MCRSLITIFQYRDLPQAGLDKSILEDNGINCFLENEFTIGVNWLYSTALGGVKLKVIESDADRAREILRHYHEPPPEAGAGSETEGSGPACPRCGSPEIETRNYTRKLAAISLLLTFPLCFFLKRYQCKKCGYKWK